MKRATSFLLSLTVAAFALTTLATPASAQELDRDGFFIGFGLGFGSLGVEGADDRESALSGYFKLGGEINDQFLLGVESNSWYKDEDGATLTSSIYSVVAYLYPGESNFHVRGGLGLARIDVDLGVLGSGSEEAFGFTLGAGYDIGVGERFALTPFGNYYRGSFDGGSSDVFQFGLGLNWY